MEPFGSSLKTQKGRKNNIFQEKFICENSDKGDLLQTPSLMTRDESALILSFELKQQTKQKSKVGSIP
jgi:hypothetical protein